jgi:hypothetical protein
VQSVTPARRLPRMDITDLFLPLAAALVATVSVLGLAWAIGRHLQQDSIDVDLAVCIGVLVGLIALTHEQSSWLY